MALRSRKSALTSRDNLGALKTKRGRHNRQVVRRVHQGTLAFAGSQAATGSRARWALPGVEVGRRLDEPFVLFELVEDGRRLRCLEKLDRARPLIDVADVESSRVSLAVAAPPARQPIFAA